MKDTTQRGRHRQQEKQAPCRDPDVGLDHRTPGSRPGLKAGVKSLGHPGIPDCVHFLAMVDNAVMNIGV